MAFNNFGKCYGCFSEWAVTASDASLADEKEPEFTWYKWRDGMLSIGVPCIKCKYEKNLFSGDIGLIYLLIN